MNGQASSQKLMVENSTARKLASYLEYIDDNRFTFSKELIFDKNYFPEEIDPNYIDKHGNTFLHYAMQFGDMRAVLWLLHYNANPNQADKNGLTPFHLSVQYNSYELNSLVLQKGGNPENMDNKNQLPLHFAARANSTNGIRVLLEAGSPINPRDINGYTPLFMAVLHESPAAATYLAARDVDVNIPDNSGCSPLHWVVTRRKIEWVILLLECGSDPFLKDRNNKSAFDLACEDTTLRARRDIFMLLQTKK